jgi:UDP-N-acetylmuramoylalanine--D-glutamate ligase
LVLAPGVPLTHPAPHPVVALARSAGVEVIGDIELFCRERRSLAPDSPFVAVTGTNGKSTTTALVAHLAASAGMDAQVGGNIGTAVLSLQPPQAASVRPRRVHVIECSSYQIDLTPSLDPSIGILINLSEDHLDRHGTMENYAAIKERLVAGVPHTGTAVVGIDDAWSRAIAARLLRSGKHVVRISVQRELNSGFFVAREKIMQATRAGTAPLASLNGIGALRGLHNAQNAACAAAAALALGLEPEAIRSGLHSFPGLAHRMEVVAHRGRVLFVNDSKATNADSAARALACFDEIFWIAGGRAKTGGIAALREFFPRIRKAYLIGEAAEDFGRTLADVVPHENAQSLDRALTAAAHDAERCEAAEPVVLFSPACASFDQFRNFEERGEAFCRLVRALPGVTAK